MSENTNARTAFLDSILGTSTSSAKNTQAMSDAASRQAVANIAALPDQQNLWNNSTSYAQQAAAQQAAPGKAFGYDPQQAAFLEQLFQPMNPTAGGPLMGRPNPMTGMVGQALAAQSLADRKAKGAGTMAALSLDQLEQSNKISNSPLAQLASSPEIMKMMPWLVQQDLNNQMSFAGMSQQGMAGAAPNQQEQMRKDYIKAFKDYSSTGDSSALESLLPKGMFGGGYVPNQYGAPMNLNSTVASEMANFGAMQNDSANNLKTTVANANALHGATQTLSELKPGIVTTSPVTGTMSGILNSVFSKTPGASAMFGTMVDATTLNSMRRQLADAAGADEKTVNAAISTDKDGKLTMNNDAMISSFATAKKNILNKTYEQLAGGMTGDYQGTLRNAPQNANTATAASIVNGTQQQLRGLFNNLTVNNGIDINGQQVKSGDAALNSFVVRVDKDGNKTVYPISALIQDAPVKSGGSMESLTETVKDAVKTGEYMSAAAAQKWAKTPEGQLALGQIKNNVGVTSNTPDVPDTTTGNMTSAGKVKTNSWLDNIINSK